MLKKKILGAKVLDTNGYVQATRLVTPVKQSGKYQLGDILNADAVDQIVSKAIEEHGVDVQKLQDNIKESVDNAKKEIVAGASEDYDTMKEVADYIIKHKGEYATLSTTVSNISTDVNNYKSTTNESINTVKKDLTNEVSRAKTAEEANTSSIQVEVNRAKAAEAANKEAISTVKSTIQGITINGSYNKDTNKLTINLVIPGVSNPATCQIDMADIIDQNDLVDSDTTTVERVDGKSKTNVNVMSDDDVQNLIDKIQ